eukprot:3862471-Rhodomonas_salina.2
MVVSCIRFGVYQASPTTLTRVQFGEQWQTVNVTEVPHCPTQLLRNDQYLPRKLRRNVLYRPAHFLQDVQYPPRQ